MAENIGVPYAEIVKGRDHSGDALFRFGFLDGPSGSGQEWAARAARLKACPVRWGRSRRQWHLALPLAVLVYLLLNGYTPLFAGSVGLALTVIMILGGSVALGIGPLGLRIAFWIAIALVSVSMLKYGVGVLLSVLAVLVLANFFVRGGGDTLVMCRDALADGARQALPVGLACAIVGTVIGTMTLTGAATTFGGYIVSWPRVYLRLSPARDGDVDHSRHGTADHPDLHHHGIACGAGLAQTRRAADRQPHVRVLLRHHRRPDATGGAGRTPAAPIAKASPDAIGWQATRIALAGFLIPFMSVFEPALMLQQGGALASSQGYWIEVAWVLFQGLRRYRDDGRRCDRLPVHADVDCGAGIGRCRGRIADFAIALDRPGRPVARVGDRDRQLVEGA